MLFTVVQCQILLPLLFFIFSRFETPVEPAFSNIKSLHFKTMIGSTKANPYLYEEIKSQTINLAHVRVVGLDRRT